MVLGCSRLLGDEGSSKRGDAPEEARFLDVFSGPCGLLGGSRPAQGVLGESHHGRVLYFRYNRPYDTDIYLLSRTADTRQESLLYGVGIPFLVLAGAGIALRKSDDSTTS